MSSGGESSNSSCESELSELEEEVTAHSKSCFNLKFELPAFSVLCSQPLLPLTYFSNTETTFKNCKIFTADVCVLNDDPNVQ